MPKITLYPSSVAPNEDDLLVIEDSVTANTKKIKRSDLLGGNTITATNDIATDAIAGITDADSGDIYGITVTNGKMSGDDLTDGSVPNAKIDMPTLTYPFPNYASPTTISTGTYTAPSNGWIQARSIVLTSTFGSSASITISGAEVYSLNWNSGILDYNIQSTALVPIAKGQIATFNLANGATWSFRRFYPALTATAS